ncbi:MAG: alpha-ketoacid dehydrogenase subunit beta [Chloroflexi bacterium]|nr:alpha-ketoacid dehydrogenase subunit beta [Chloroflexota bacterium]HCU79818.1 alpha-ketoacid dehydrogenase subunit beta [Chloroflexota bacterium]|tara:strand:+ start:34723 stop:35697 length:975 start_codon:yes stop_codon:yes gene_type:complete
MPEITFLQAINQALHQEMEADNTVFMLGQDIGILGGAFKATEGLFDKFGRERVIDTPMCEYAFSGLANGAALMGLRPIVEFQFADFISTGFDPIVQFAATHHYRQNNPLPIVFRAPWGGGSYAGPFHSQCPEAWFAHTAGLKVVIPSNPYDAKGLLISAIRDPNPVIFFEPKYLYRSQSGEVPSDAYTVDLGLANVAHTGDDISIITYGAMVPEAITASKILHKSNISCEVIDLRTISPLDSQTILDSVKKTGKVLVLHEARKTAGIGAEIAAIVSENAFEYLDAPITRVTAPDTPVPYSPPLENAYRPNSDSVIQAAKTLYYF